MEKEILTQQEVSYRLDVMAEKIRRDLDSGERVLRVYGIPRGGVPIALGLGGRGFSVVETAAQADVVVDDIRDSGKTAERYARDYPLLPFYALIDKKGGDSCGWVVFPWEASEEASIEDAFVRLIQYVGEDPERGGLKETPLRMARAWREWCKGYNEDPKCILKTFDDGGSNYDQQIVIRDLPFYSHCEHHLAPFFGTVSIGYIPNEGRIVGLSKFGRLVDAFSRRLQVQERLTTQVAMTIWDELKPIGVGVVIRARHMCMESRGICKSGEVTVTSKLLGVHMTSAKANEEFLLLTR